MARYFCYLLAMVLATACSKERADIMPCDSDLGHLGKKLHLANVRFLTESRQVDWFELYDNLEDRRSMRPAANCIPAGPQITTEREIARQENARRYLR